MDSLRNFIDENRESFNTSELRSGHKERFLKRLKDQKTESHTKFIIMLQWARMAVASVVVILMAIPIFVNQRFSQMESGEYFTQLLENQSDRIEKLANTLDPETQYNVKSTLRQLTEDPIPLVQQLPNSISRKVRREIVKGYYNNKLEGAERLETYVKSLVE